MTFITKQKNTHVKSKKKCFKIAYIIHREKCLGGDDIYDLTKVLRKNH